MKLAIKSFLLPFLSVAIALVITLLVLEVTFRVLPTSGSLMAQAVNEANPVLRFRENRDVLISQGYNFALAANKHVNNFGFVNDQAYDPDDQTPLMAIIGDSYVEATQLENRHTMHGLLATEVATRGRVYSFGVSGAPLSTYLAYAEYARKTFSPDSMIFIVVGNDFDESISTYKFAPGLHFFVPNGAGFDLERVDYTPAYFQNLARQSALCRYLVLNLKLSFSSLGSLFLRQAVAGGVEFVGNTRAATGARRVADSKAAVDEFLRRLPASAGLANDKIVMVVDGLRPNLYDAASLEKAQKSYFSTMRDYFMLRSSGLGFDVIDLQPIFIATHQASGERFEFPSDAHWNSAGHRTVAAAIKNVRVFKSLFVQ